MKDPYTYEDGTLRNKLNIRDHQELRQAEADIGFLKLINIELKILNTKSEGKTLYNHRFNVSNKEL